MLTKVQPTHLKVDVLEHKQNSEVQAAGGHKAGGVVQAICGQQAALDAVNSF